MISTLFLTLVWINLVALTSPLQLLADATMPAGFTNVIHVVSGYISMFTTSGILLPLTIQTILAILGFSLAFEAGYLLYKIIYWVIKKIPTIS